MSEARTERHPVSSRVVAALASATDTEPRNVDPPLYETVDADALDAVVASATDVELSFEHDGHTVVVRADGSVVVDGTVHASAREMIDA
ncbi:HalOD1 output domain-containing protein [Halobacterium rubrum]|uniref:HalOD1 output domain-containing protein n=1 Tax=Halobacterium TaxID=2239 RepID=UPI001F2E9939|nr:MULTISPECIES: HalOD1 output domain-containing protein [Halobacterium]MDH5018927.1 hypothetical protein [Halobacterium rubrum]